MPHFWRVVSATSYRWLVEKPSNFFWGGLPQFSTDMRPTIYNYIHLLEILAIIYIYIYTIYIYTLYIHIYTVHIYIYIYIGHNLYTHSVYIYIYTHNSWNIGPFLEQNIDGTPDSPAAFPVARCACWAVAALPRSSSWRTGKQRRGAERGWFLTMVCIYNIYIYIYTHIYLVITIYRYICTHTHIYIYVI